MLSLRKSGMDTLSPDKLSLLLLSRKPIQPTLSPPECWWLEPRGISSPASKILEIAASMAFTKLRDPRSHPELALFCTCKQLWIANTEFVHNLLSSASSSSSSSIHSSNSSKSNSRLSGLEGRSCAAEWLRFFVSTRVLFFTAERVPISGLPIIWRLSC